MIGIVLVIVGFVLFHNAWFGLIDKKEIDGKTLSVVNFMGGAAILAISLLVMSQGGYGEGYFSAMIYVMVGLTYIYIGFDHLFGLNPRAFGVFCLTGAIALAVGGIGVIAGDDFGGIWDIWLVLMWFSWAILWFILFIEYAFDKQKQLAKLSGVICLLTTFYTGWIPGIMLLMDWWG